MSTQAKTTYASAYSLQRLEDPDELEAECRGVLEHMSEAKWPIGLQSFENAAYLMGNTHTRWYYSAEGGLGVHRLGLDDKSKFDSLIAKSADNRLIRPVESVAAMLTIDDPQPRVAGSTDEPADQDAAEIGERWLESLWETPLDMARLTYEAAILGAITPGVAIEVFYDETDIPLSIPGTKIEKVMDPILGEEVEREVEGGEDEIVYKKDFTARIWNHFHLVPDPHATSWSDMTWIARQSYEDKDAVMKFFDRDEEFFMPDRLNGMNVTGKAGDRHIMYWWSKFQDIIPSPQYYNHGAGLTSQTGRNDGDGIGPDQVILTVIDVKPSEEFPQGRTLVLAGGTIVYMGPARAYSEEYPWRWHPYAGWSWFKVPGKFWGVPLLSQLVPLQKKINAIDALVHANRQYMALGQYFVPDSCDIPDGFFSGFPGQVIPYTDNPNGAKPERVKNEALPGELFGERQVLINSIEWISGTGLSDPSISPSAMRSGAQMQQQQQERLKAKTPMLKGFAKMIETVSQNVLIETQRALRNEDQDLLDRMRKVATEYASFSFDTFAATSLRDHHSVKIDIVSGQINTPEAMAQKAETYWQFSGGQLPPDERAGVVQALGLDKFIKEKQAVSLKYAQRVLSRIKLGHFDDVDPAQTMSLLAPGVASASGMVSTFGNAILDDSFHELEDQRKTLIMAAHELLGQQAAAEQEQQMAMMMKMQESQKGSPQQ